MPDLILYRRHQPECPGTRRGRLYKKCKCPIWCDGRVDGKRINHSMKTKDWDRAERKMLRATDPGALVLNKQPVADAVKAFLEDCGARQLRASTIVSYTKPLNTLCDFCTSNNVKHVQGITLDLLSKFRQSRTGRDGKTRMKGSTQRKELELFRNFGRFCDARGWAPQGNPATAMKPPKDDRAETLPFEPDEVKAILEACGKIENNYRASAERARIRARALVLVMLYSGMRISDVALLERSRLDRKTGKLLMRTMKTGAPLYVTLPASVLHALDDLPVESRQYFFWSGIGKPDSIIGSLRRTVDCVLKLAGVKGHPHQFRDTFSVRLLENDTPIRTVQLLLGHSSVQTTERHYAPWVRSHQKLLDEATARLDFSH